MDLASDITIDRRIDEVFDFLADPANGKQWQTGFVDSRQTSPGPIAVGATGTEVRHFMGRDVTTAWQVTEFRPPERFAFKVVTGPLPFEASYTCEPVSRGTRVTVAGRAPLRGLWRLTGPIMSRSMRNRYGHDLKVLKALLEAGQGRV